MAKDTKEDPDMEAALVKLTEHVQAMEERNAELISRVVAAAEREMTPRERKASARKKMADYHQEVRDGKRERLRSGPHEDAERAARAEADDAA